MSYVLDVVKPLALTIVKAQGNQLFDQAGKTYLDTFSGIAVNALGHQHPAILEALNAQANQHLHLSNFFRTQAQEQLAQSLTEASGMAKAFFTNSGTEATEAAIKLARKYGRTHQSNKTRIVSVEGAFHGRSTGAMALSGHDDTHASFTPLMEDTVRVKRDDIAALEAVMNDEVCAIVLELIYGSSGIYVLGDDFLRAVMRLAKKHQALIIVDEVQTGIMRTGSMFYFQQTPIEPDVVLAAKAIGGGLPLGAMLVKEPYIHILSPGDHGSTFGGNPLACALGQAVMNTIMEPSFLHTLCENMSYLHAQITALAYRHPKIIKDVRGVGYMLGVELYEDAIPFRDAALTHGVLLNVTSQTVIRLLPSLIFTRDEINALTQSLETLFLKT